MPLEDKKTPAILLPICPLSDCGLSKTSKIEKDKRFCATGTKRIQPYTREAGDDKLKNSEVFVTVCGRIKMVTFDDLPRNPQTLISQLLCNVIKRCHNAESICTPSLCLQLPPPSHSPPPAFSPPPPLPSVPYWLGIQSRLVHQRGSCRFFTHSPGTKKQQQLGGFITLFDADLMTTSDCVCVFWLLSLKMNQMAKYSDFWCASFSLTCACRAVYSIEMWGVMGPRAPFGSSDCCF